MKKIMFILSLTSMIFASGEVKEKTLEQKQLDEQLKKEQKYAQEQKFYTQDEYDFSGAEVNPESLKNIKAIEVDDMDMDDVYD